MSYELFIGLLVTVLIMHLSLVAYHLYKAFKDKKVSKMAVSLIVTAIALLLLLFITTNSLKELR